MRIAVLMKQVPRFEQLELGDDGRLRRDGIPNEINPFCRRAISKGVELSSTHMGSCAFFTLGPSCAVSALEEATAWARARGVDSDAYLLTDPAFAGSDTLATARALSAALRLEGPFDLVLTGRNSVDADTGQVAPELAELLGIPFLANARDLEIVGRLVHVTSELDDGTRSSNVALPAVISCAERLCEPAKVSQADRSTTLTASVRRLTAADLGSGPWGQAGSPTRVGEIRGLSVARLQRRLEGDPREQVQVAVRALQDLGALGDKTQTAPRTEVGMVPATEAGGNVVAVLLDDDRAPVARELLGAAAQLAALISGTVVAFGSPDAFLGRVGSWGADHVVRLEGSTIEEDVAAAISNWCSYKHPWAVLAPATTWGREVASRVAARLDSGLIGDAIGLDVSPEGRLTGWKPAFGGAVVAAITSTSSTQLVTVRPGVLPLDRPRASSPPSESRLRVHPADRIRHTGEIRNDTLEALTRAHTVVGVGTGVSRQDYGALIPLLEVLGAELAATRKVTDLGWQPRSRQVGITGRTISPHLYVAIGLSGKFNHMLGVRNAGHVVAINTDSAAPVFDHADIGITADWREVVPLLVAALNA